MHSHSARTASARIRTFAILATAVLTLAAVTSVAWAQASEGDLPFDPDAHRGTLGNGLTWYVKENREPLNRAQLRLAIRAGSILEEENERGLAHYVEHMAFDGTERFAGHETHRIPGIDRLQVRPRPERTHLVRRNRLQDRDTNGRSGGNRDRVRDSQRLGLRHYLRSGGGGAGTRRGAWRSGAPGAARARASGTCSTRCCSGSRATRSGCRSACRR